MHHPPPRWRLVSTLALSLAPAAAHGAPTGEPTAPADPERADPERSDPERAGPERAGPERAGPERAGPERAGPAEADGSRGAGPSIGPAEADIVPDRSAEPSSLIGADVELLTLEEAIELALKRHPRLAAARHQVTAVKSRIGQAQAAYMPQIDAGLQYVRASENGSTASVHSFPGMSRTGGTRRMGVTATDSFNNYLAVLAVNQVIWDFGRTQGAVGAQRAAALAAEMELTQVEQTVVFEVMRAFYDVRAAREAVRVADDIYVSAQAILELANAAREVGLKPPSESARAEANVAAAEVARIRANARLEVAQAAVAGALGMPSAAYEPREDIPAPGTVPDEDRSIEIALDNRPELQVLGYRRQGLEQDLRRVKAQRYPQLDARASVNSRGQFLPTAGQDPYQQFNWNIGVVVSIPVFQGLRVKKQKEEIEAQVGVVDSNHEMVRQAVVVEVRQALAAVRAADAAAVASLRGVEAARSALETLESRYREGLAKLVELTDAQATYVQARSQLLEATYDRYLSRAVLSLTMGQLPPS